MISFFLSFVKILDGLVIAGKKKDLTWRALSQSISISFNFYPFVFAVKNAPLGLYMGEEE